MSFTLTTALLTPGVGQTISLKFPSQILAVKVTNKSFYDVQYSGFGVQGIDWLAAGVEYMLYSSVQDSGILTLLAFNTANITPANAGAVLITEYLQGEELPKGSWPVSIPAQIVQLQTGVVTANNIVNSGNPSGTNIITAQPTGDTNFPVLLDNAGNLTLGDVAHPGSFSLTGGGATISGLTVTNTANIGNGINLTSGALDVHAATAMMIAGHPAEQTIVTGNTISVPSGIIKSVQAAASVTGIIMGVGTIEGQMFFLIQHSGTGITITFAAAGANVRGGSGTVLSAGKVFAMWWDNTAGVWYISD